MNLIRKQRVRRKADFGLFGKDFFDTMQTSFMPINIPNLDDSYILDFGDVLQIQLIGQNDSNEKYSIQDGSIIPGIGKLYVSGLSLMEANDLVQTKMSNTYIGKSLRNINKYQRCVCISFRRRL